LDHNGFIGQKRCAYQRPAKAQDNKSKQKNPACSRPGRQAGRQFLLSVSHIFHTDVVEKFGKG
jgi:hypothetical protein